jgi:tetratricopeptide (TPR) repeat protein
MFDRHEHRKTEQLKQYNHEGDNVGRDKYITHNHLHGSVDYQKLLEEIKDGEELLAGIAPERTDLRLKQSKKLNDLKQQLEDFKADVFRLHELINRISINTERLRRAKEHFDKGEFREADAVLKAEEINAEVEQLQVEKRAATERLAAIERDLEGRANEYLIKARIALVSSSPEGSSRFEMADKWFEQALATVRTAYVLHEYAVFLYEQNAFRRAEPLYQEALKQYRSLAEGEPEVFCPDLAMTLHNLAAIHNSINAYDLALDEYEESLEISRILAESNPEIFLSELAITLNNLANLLCQQNVFNPALKKYQEALEIRRRLAAEHKTFLPDVAVTLNNLAMLHYQTQEYVLALAEYEEALEIYRNLRKAEPKAFLPDMAKTLINFGDLHKIRKEYKPALTKYKGALKIFRCLGESDPEAFLPYVAATLNNLAGLHGETEKYGAAVKEFEEALKIKRSFAEAEPKAFLPVLAKTLLNLSIFHLEAVPDKVKSIAYAEEVRIILIPLCKQAPHLQGDLDMAEGLLKDNAAKPDAAPARLLDELSQLPVLDNRTPDEIIGYDEDGVL